MSKPPSILSVPKNSCIACRVALLVQLCPDGWSGNGGVDSGGTVGVDGSNNGFHAGSASVAGFPSLSASWIASIGRQKFQWNLSFQQPIAPSAAARLVIAYRRAFAAVVSPNRAENHRIRP